MNSLAVIIVLVLLARSSVALVDFDDAVGFLSAPTASRCVQRVIGRSGLPSGVRDSPFYNPTTAETYVLPLENAFFALEPIEVRRFGGAVDAPEPPAPHGATADDCPLRMSLERNASAEAPALELLTERLLLWSGDLLFDSDGFSAVHHCSVVLGTNGADRVLFFEEDGVGALLGTGVEGRFDTADSEYVLPYDDASDSYWLEADEQCLEAAAHSLLAVRFRPRDKQAERLPNRRRSGTYATVSATRGAQQSVDWMYAPAQQLVVAGSARQLYQLERNLRAAIWPTYRRFRFDSEADELAALIDNDKSSRKTADDDDDDDHDHDENADSDVRLPGWTQRWNPDGRQVNPISFSWEIESKEGNVANFYRPESVPERLWTALNWPMKRDVLNAVYWSNSTENPYDFRFQGERNPKMPPAKLIKDWGKPLASVMEHVIALILNQTELGWAGWVKCDRHGFCCSATEPQLVEGLSTCPSKVPMYKWLPDRLQNELRGGEWEIVDPSYCEDWTEFRLRLLCLQTKLIPVPDRSYRLSLHIHVVWQPSPIALEVKAQLATILAFSDLLYMFNEKPNRPQSFSFGLPAQTMVDQMMAQLEYGYLAQETTLIGANWGSFKQAYLGIRHGPYGPGKIGLEFRMGTMVATTLVSALEQRHAIDLPSLDLVLSRLSDADKTYSDHYTRSFESARFYIYLVEQALRILSDSRGIVARAGLAAGRSSNTRLIDAMRTFRTSRTCDDCSQYDRCPLRLQPSSDGPAPGNCTLQQALERGMHACTRAMADSMGLWAAVGLRMRALTRLCTVDYFAEPAQRDELAGACQRVTPYLHGLGAEGGINCSTTHIASRCNASLWFAVVTEIVEALPADFILRWIAELV